MTGVPFDAGLQAERTLLAWRRTALAVAVASATAARLALPVLGALALVAGAVGLLLAIGAYLHASRRYRRTHLDLLRSARPSLGGGISLGLLAAATTSLCVLGLAYVMLIAGSPEAALFP